MSQFLGFAIPGIPYGCTYAIVAVGPGPHLPGHRRLQLRLRRPGLHLGLRLHQAGPERGPARSGWPSSSRWSSWPRSSGWSSTASSSARSRTPTRRPSSSPASASSSASRSCCRCSSAARTSTTRPASSSTRTSSTSTSSRTPINGIDLSSVVVTAAVLVALVILMRFTNLGLQMRGAVESRRLVQLDGVNAGTVVATAWAISSFMAGLAGVMLAPLNNQLQFSRLRHPAGGGLRRRRLGVAALPAHRRPGRGADGRGRHCAPGLPAGQQLRCSAAVLPSLPFIVLVAALLLVPGMRSLDDTKDPLASVDPPAPPTTATLRAPQLEPDHPAGLVRAPRRPSSSPC